MHQRHAILIFILASCSGCDKEPPAPETTVQHDRNAPEQATAASSPTNPPAITDDHDSRQGLDVDHEQRQYVSFPAAGVKLVRPSGFDDAENFHGFQQPPTQSSIMVLMIPGPFSEATRAFTPEQMIVRGMTLRSKSDVEVEGKSGVLLSATQSAYGMDFAKWILAFGDENQTTMVTATFPEAEEANLSDELKSVVLSAKIDDTPAPPPGADVGFTLAASGKLKVTRGLGKMLMYTKDGVIPVKSPEDPLFVAAPSISNVLIGNKRQFAVQRLLQTSHTNVGSVASNTEITIDGLEGYEILAEAEDADSGTPLKVYQVVLFDGEGYILIQGLVGANVADDYLPEFQAMAHSLTRNPR